MEHRAVITTDQAARTISCVEDDVETHLDSYNPAESQDFGRLLKQLEDETEARRQRELQYSMASWTLCALDNVLWDMLPQADRDAWSNFGTIDFERVRRRAKDKWDTTVWKATQAGHPTPIPSGVYALANRAYAHPDGEKHQALVGTLMAQLGTTGFGWRDETRDIRSESLPLARPFSRTRRL